MLMLYKIVPNYGKESKNFRPLAESVIMLSDIPVKSKIKSLNEIFTELGVAAKPSASGRIKLSCCLQQYLKLSPAILWRTFHPYPTETIAIRNDSCDFSEDLPRPLFGPSMFYFYAKIL